MKEERAREQMLHKGQRQMRESDGRQDEGWMSPKYAEAREAKEGVNPSWAGGKQDEVAG